MSPLNSEQPFDPAVARARLASARGPVFWRSLEELADSEAFQAWLRREQPQMLEAMHLGRRDFLSLMGASLALAGLSACGSPPQTQIVPYIKSPEGQTDGLPRFFASTLVREGYGCGVLIESNMGRPTKIEGNPLHPSSLGATDIFSQAAVLQLWDPERSQAISYRGVDSSREEFAKAVQALRERLAKDQGRGLRVLTGAVGSPALGAQLAKLQDRYPQARWYMHQADDRSNVRAGAVLAFGQPFVTRLRLDRAKVVLSLDADFLSDPAAGVRYARDYAATRAGVALPGAASRLYVIEPTPTLTGSMADHRLALEPEQIGGFARLLAARLGVTIETHASASFPPRWLDALAADLKAVPGAGLIIVGAAQPAWLHALGHLMNAALGSAGSTLEYIDPTPLAPVALPHNAAPGNLPDLVTELREGSVGTLLVLGANPAYDAPTDLNFATAVKSVQLWHLGLYRDETALLAEWHLPQAHALESWSDAAAYDGTVSIVQPLIAPLYGGQTAHQMLATLLGEEIGDGRDWIRNQWRGQLPEDSSWLSTLRTGLIANTQLPSRAPAVRSEFLTHLPANDSHDGLNLCIRLDPTIGDGAWSNNAWLQELPKPLTQLTWENAALVSPALAEELKLANGDVVELSVDANTLKAPVWIMPGQAARTVTVHLGYGRRAAGKVGTGQGFDAYQLRSSANLWHAKGLQVRRTGSRAELASTQQHFNMEGRDLVRVATLAQQAQAHSAAPAPRPPPSSLYPDFPAGQYAWGMSIDLDACIGCKACTIACQAENNIPVVGREQVRRGREMHWIRVDRYFEGSAQNPRMYAQPVPCMMCEHAPCELVCPVGATVHDSEGLNLQVYNRCVGTRFCSNNCPYKVRRFNFLQYVDESAEALKAQRNPQVTVRQRGVMEKCTYCIQRIESAHIEADKRQRPIADGEVVTACQAVCPTQAIRFGNVADPKSQVAQAKQTPRNYVLLEELNTRPRTSYLSRLRNPHPTLDDEPA